MLRSAQNSPEGKLLNVKSAFKRFKWSKFQLPGTEEFSVWARLSHVIWYLFCKT